MGQITSSETKQLLKAAKQGKYDVVAELVGKNPSLIVASDWLGGQTVWHVAAIHGQLTVMKAMESALSQGPTGPDSWKPLLRLGHSLQSIMEQVVNREDSRVRTPLHYACMNGHTECAAFLIELGADPWLGDMLGGRTCLHYAAAAGHPECLKAVLCKCAGRHPTGQAPRPNRAETQLVDVRNTGGFAPLHYAVWASQPDTVQALLSFEAYLFPRNVSPSGDWIQCAEGSTPLHLAAIKGNVEVAKVILKAYAECMVLDSSTGAVTAVSRHRNNLPDPRLVLNGRNQLPFQIAQRLGNQAMAEILHPSIPFAFLFSSSDFQAETRMFGPCRLAVLAANALQQKLKQDIQAAVDKLQELVTNPEQLKSASLDALLAKPPMNGSSAHSDLAIGADQRSNLPPISHKVESTPALPLATGSGSADASTTEADANGGADDLAHANSEPTPSPFRITGSSAADLFRNWATGNPETSTAQQSSGNAQVRDVDVRLRMRGSSRRLLSLGSIERTPPAQPAEEQSPVEESVHAPNLYPLQDTLPFISGRLGGDKEAFREQFRLLRLTAGVQQANWQMGQPLLPPQRTRSVPKPLPFKHVLKRTNTDSPANLLAIAQDPHPLTSAHSEPSSHTPSELPSAGSPPKGDHRPPKSHMSPVKKATADSIVKSPSVTEVLARTPPLSGDSGRRTSNAARRTAFVIPAGPVAGETTSTTTTISTTGDLQLQCAGEAGADMGQRVSVGDAGLPSPAKGKVSFDLDEDEDDAVCEICMDKPLQLNISVCKHKLCVDCASELCKLHHFRPALCPFCRAIIAGFTPCSV